MEKFIAVKTWMRIAIFENSFISCISLMAIFTFFSFISCALPSETKKYRGKHLEAAIRQDAYHWWLLISIIVSVPSIFFRVLDFSREWPTAKDIRILHRNALISRLLEVFSIAIPNLCLYFLLTTSEISSHILGQIQISLFYSQIITIIGSIFCSTFGNKYSNIGKHSQHYFSVEKFTVSFLAAFVGFKVFLTMSVMVEGTGETIFLILSFVLLISGLIIMSIAVFKFGRLHTFQMKIFQFTDYNQMHDFYRMLGVTVFACYSFGIYIHSNQILSHNTVFDQNATSFIELLIGKVVLVVYLIIIDQQCAVFEVKIKSEMLEARLNLIRYISHEMRSPLNTSFLGLRILHGNIDAIVNSMKRIKMLMIRCKVPDPNGSIMQLVEKTIDDKDGISETAELVKESCSIALQTLNDMLTVDKIDEKKLSLEMEEINVWNFVSETVRPFRINAMKDHVSLLTECIDAESNWTKRSFIKADKFKLCQVLRNFLSNALKFCSKQQGEVIVKVEHLRIPSRIVEPIDAVGHAQIVHEVVRISVNDNGAGISLENQRKLFGQYVQFNANVLQNGQGSGLGLWISKSLQYYKFYLDSSQMFKYIIVCNSYRFSGNAWW